MPRKKRFDKRPICNCSAYSFPHRIGGKCDGSAYTAFYNIYDASLCSSCNCCNLQGECDITNGAESIEYAECYQEFSHSNPGQHLPLEFVEPEYPDDYCDLNSHLNVDF